MERLGTDYHLINEEYNIWKKRTPFLYDLVFTKALEWPSLTCQWLPGKREKTQGDYSVEKLILGTNTSDGEQNHLMIAEARIPEDNAEGDGTKYKDCAEDASGAFKTGRHGKIEIVQKINHDGEENRARQSQQADLFVFDTSIHHFKPSADGICTPQLRLRGHKKGGYGVSWSPLDAGKLVSGADDKLICTWDIQSSYIRSGGHLDPIATYEGHTDVVEDVAWHALHSNVFSSGDDRKLLIWDTRERDRKNPLQKLEAHKSEISCVSFNPFSEFLLATGSADRTVALWDMRNMNLKVHSFENHADGILKDEWSPFSEAIQASGSADRRINIWNLAKIFEKQDPKDAEAGLPELMFIHGGHTNKVSDFSWNRNEPWVFVSVSDDNTLQLWAMAEEIYEEENRNKEETKVDTANQMEDIEKKLQQKDQPLCEEDLE